jgi:hypothetical protein
MRTRLCYLLTALVLFVPRLVFGQGLLVNVNPHESVSLPRPAVGPGQLIVAPRPAASSYKIKEISVHVQMTEQVARTQVSQSFVNTGGTPMEVCFVFTAVRRSNRPTDALDRRQGAACEACCGR